MNDINSLPEGWSEDSLGNLVDFSIGKTPKRDNPDYWNGEHKWATISDLVFGEELKETNEKITDNAIKETNCRLVKHGTLLFSFKLTIGKMAFAGCDLYTNEAIAALVPKSDKIEPKFLFYALQVAGLKSYAGDAAKGKTLNTKTLPLIRVSFPNDKNEQHRIVSQIEEQTCRADKVQRLVIDRENDIELFLNSTYYKIIEGAEWKPLRKVASLIRRKVDTKPDEKYEEMGVRSFGRGTFKKPVLTGHQIGNKRIYYINKEDLVFNNVFAWEGAIAVAQPEDHGRVGSHRFITYAPHDGVATSEFLCHHFLCPKGLEDIGAASPGSAGRNRTLGLKKLDNIQVPVPEHKKQKRFEEIAKLARKVKLEATEIHKELSIYKAAIIEKAFRGEL